MSKKHFRAVHAPSRCPERPGDPTPGAAGNVVRLHGPRSTRGAEPESPGQPLDRRILVLRRLAHRLLINPPTDWEHACRVIAADGCASVQGFAAALLGAMNTHATQRTVFFQPSATDLSDAETWLQGVFAAFDRGDEPSVRALTGFRIAPAGRRRVAFLAAGLHRALNEADCDCVAIASSSFESFDLSN